MFACRVRYFLFRFLCVFFFICFSFKNCCVLAVFFVFFSSTSLVSRGREETGMVEGRGREGGLPVQFYIYMNERMGRIWMEEEEFGWIGNGPYDGFKGCARWTKPTPNKTKQNKTAISWRKRMLE